ncbi:MAG TPA: lasso peptide biosynthesis B2 protein [Steroidobacteraceae bacterium]|nr:lasso peptide biosynthesis B2 protein [Steroidobacteraceae bacterium]
MQQSYFLAPHVYPCVTDDHVVLLDLQRDKYVGVSREQMAGLAARVKGWPVPESLAPGEPSADSAAGASSAGDVRTPNATAASESVINKMLAAGMLTTDASVGKEARPVQMPRPDAVLVIEDLETRPEVRLVHVVRFLWASGVTALSLRWRSIESVIASLSARNKAGRARAPTLDLDTARTAVAAFIRLRPLLFGAQDACLFDSLAMMRYLSYFRVFPTCVIGVQTGPFGAHCWVQHETMVFNDVPEYVRRFTPILAV